MTQVDTLYVATRREWRRWLNTQGRSAPDIWLIYYKKHTGKPTLSYDEAVEEAICYGWIDTTVRRIDDERYMQRFTPRRRRSKWSALNRRRAEALLARKKVAAPGRACIDEAKQNGNWEAAFSPAEKKRRADPEMPPELEAALKENPKAAEFFAALTPGRRRQFMGWVGVAKKKETRQRRAAESVGLLKQGKDLGMK